MIESLFLYLTTIGWRTGKQHRIEIWYVTHNEKYYIMSERGINAHWVRNINHYTRISFNINNSNYEGEARIIDSSKESQLAAQVSEIMNAKISLGSRTNCGTRTIGPSLRQRLRHELLF